MNTRTPVYCPSCCLYWWSMDDNIIGMTCGLGDDEGVIRRASRDELEESYAKDWSGLT